MPGVCQGVLHFVKMKKLTWLILFAASYLHAETAEVIRKIPHTGYSEGLDFHEGFLWHALPKEILKIDPADGAVVARFKPPTDHSESLHWWKGKLYHLSFSDNGIYVGGVANNQLALKKMGTVPEDHGWGIVSIGSQIVTTGNFSSKLYFFDSNLKLVRTLTTDAKDIEDLAWDGSKIWASSFTLDRGKIFPIDPKTGKTGTKYLIPGADDDCPVIDGIAYDGKNFWVTGKNCLSIYYVKHPK